MSQRGHVHIRTCVGCRKRREKGEMVRFKQSENGIFFMDDKKKLGGRGIYLCPDETCLRLAQKKIRLGRRIGGSERSFGSRFPEKGLV